jgi:hypothetical protein
MSGYLITTTAGLQACPETGKPYEDTYAARVPALTKAIEGADTVFYDGDLAEVCRAETARIVTIEEIPDEDTL